MDSKIQKHWQRMEEGKAYYDALLQVFSPEQLNFHPEVGSWSMLDVMQHLYTSEHISLQFMQNFDFNRKNEKVGLKAAVKTMMLVNRLNSRKKYQAPKILGEKKESLNISEDPHQFSHQWDKIRSDMFTFLTDFDKEKIGHFIFSHPAVGKLNILQTMQFFVAHMKHHQYQIETINHHKNFPK
ncbi:DinB family protein [Marivirga harenae]|mgnify:CR=1 FL=1|uniref:DinB family protein n=1 Tax=Marivirga harenae TaxID=2010992 RepID=UPI0026E0BA78|nr:DinB family protein [Marivirga harenae]WKV11169.1 DinB family protein [Marivirga harenae]|tara:strand:+ start:30428 stop:30976 length:549 start_codon:yes stop_codon:yes gene_type:complete